MSYIERIEECNAHDSDHFRPFLVAKARVGWINEAFADVLAEFEDVFRITDAAVTLASALDTFAARSRAVAGVVGELVRRGIVTGWREEFYPVGTAYHALALFEMERAAIPRFGVAAYGVHVNGFVRRDDGIHMWIARRARDKQTYPGMLDNMVAGGQPVGIQQPDPRQRLAGEQMKGYTFVVFQRMGGVLDHAEPDVQAAGGLEPAGYGQYLAALDFGPRKAGEVHRQPHAWVSSVYLSFMAL